MRGEREVRKSKRGLLGTEAGKGHIKDLNNLLQLTPLCVGSWDQLLPYVHIAMQFSQKLTCRLLQTTSYRLTLHITTSNTI